MKINSRFEPNDFSDEWVNLISGFNPSFENTCTIPFRDKSSNPFRKYIDENGRKQKLRPYRSFIRKDETEENKQIRERKEEERQTEDLVFQEKLIKIWKRLGRKTRYRLWHFERDAFAKFKAIKRYIGKDKILSTFKNLQRFINNKECPECHICGYFNDNKKKELLIIRDDSIPCERVLFFKDTGRIFENKQYLSLCEKIPFHITHQHIYAGTKHPHVRIYSNIEKVIIKFKKYKKAIAQKKDILILPNACVIYLYKLLRGFKRLHFTDRSGNLKKVIDYNQVSKLYTSDSVLDLLELCRNQTLDKRSYEFFLHCTTFLTMYITNSWQSLEFGDIVAKSIEKVTFLNDNFKADNFLQKSMTLLSMIFESKFCITMMKSCCYMMSLQSLECQGKTPKFKFSSFGDHVDFDIFHPLMRKRRLGPSDKWIFFTGITSSPDILNVTNDKFLTPPDFGVEAMKHVKMFYRHHGYNSRPKAHKFDQGYERSKPNCFEDHFCDRGIRDDYVTKTILRNYKFYPVSPPKLGRKLTINEKDYLKRYLSLVYKYENSSHDLLLPLVAVREVINPYAEETNQKNASIQVRPYGMTSLKKEDDIKTVYKNRFADYQKFKDDCLAKVKNLISFIEVDTYEDETTILNELCRKNNFVARDRRYSEFLDYLDKYYCPKFRFSFLDVLNHDGECNSQELFGSRCAWNLKSFWNLVKTTKELTMMLAIPTPKVEYPSITVVEVPEKAKTLEEEIDNKLTMNLLVFEEKSDEIEKILSAPVGFNEFEKPYEQWGEDGRWPLFSKFTKKGNDYVILPISQKGLNKRLPRTKESIRYQRLINKDVKGKKASLRKKLRTTLLRFLANRLILKENKELMTDLSDSVILEMTTRVARIHTTKEGEYEVKNLQKYDDWEQKHPNNKNGETKTIKEEKIVITEEDKEIKIDFLKQQVDAEEKSLLLPEVNDSSTSSELLSSPGGGRIQSGGSLSLDDLLKDL